MKYRKLEIAREFCTELLRSLSEDIYGVYLFGSVAKGLAHDGSDIDILVIYSDKVNYDRMADVVDDVCYRLACRYGEVPEVTLMSYKEYRDEVGSSPFLWEVISCGKPLVLKEKSTEWELDFRDYLELAEEYLSYARDAMRENKIRLAIDTAYNSVELLCKSLIINTGSELASSHGGLIGQFSKIFVLSGKLEPKLGRELNRALRLRASARYRPRAELSSEDARFVISLAEEIMDFAKRELINRGT